jgi:hypothetical protein
MSSANSDMKAIAHPPSDGSELIPAEIQSNARRKVSSPPVDSLGSGYTRDDEGFLNNYAIEPEISKAEYPSPKQQRRYIYLGIAATVFVALAIWIAFAVT